MLWYVYCVDLVFAVYGMVVGDLCVVFAACLLGIACCLLCVVFLSLDVVCYS